MQSNTENTALVLFRVGPVLCCAPAQPVQSIISPPELTRNPGASEARPGIFHHADRTIQVSDLRVQFGIPENQRKTPGRLIITEQEDSSVAFWVDDIIEVIQSPEKGWGKLPPYIPRGIFGKTLLLNDQIHLYVEIGKLCDLPEGKYLSQYLTQFASNDDSSDKADTAAENKNTTNTVARASSNTVPENKPDKAIQEEASSLIKNDSPAENNVSTPSATLSENKITHKESVSPQQRPERDNMDNLSIDNDVIEKPEHTLVDIQKTEGQNAIEIDTSTPTDLSEVTPVSEPNKAEKHIESTDKPQSEEKVNVIPSQPEPPDYPIEPQVITSIDKHNESVNDNIDIITPDENKKPDQGITKKASEDSPPTVNESAPISSSTPVLQKKKTTYDLHDKHDLVPEKKQQPPEEKEKPVPIVLISLLVLLLTSLGTAAYFYFFTDVFSEKEKKDSVSPIEQYSRNDEATSVLEKLDAVKPTPVTENTDSVDSPVDNIAEGADKHTINKTESEDEAPPNIASSQEAEESTLKSDDKNSQYSARIKPDDNGVTIEINAPEEEPVLQNTTPDNENQTQESQETTAGDDISHKVTESEPGIKITVKQENSNKSAKEVVHIVVKGDTLWAIAKHYVNNPYQYPELARLSNIKNPDRIYPGNRVRIIHKPSDSKR